MVLRKRILLAVDGSRQALEAVRYVGGFFNPKETELFLFCVLSKVPDFFYDLGKEPLFQKRILEARGWEKAIRDSIEGFMTEARNILRNAEFPENRIITEIRERKEGIARDIILEAKKGYGAVVVGRTGLSKFKDIVVGGVANKLISSLSDISICVVDGRPKIGKILVALDESEGAMRAVDFVGPILNKTDAEVTLFHVVRGFDILEGEYEYRLDEANLEKEWIEMDKTEMAAVFAEALSRLKRAGLEAEQLGTKIVRGVPSRAGAIVQEADDGNFGTIVVGRRGLSRIQQFFMGRVSNKVIQSARKHAVWVVS